MTTFNAIAILGYNNIVVFCLFVFFKNYIGRVCRLHMQYIIKSHDKRIRNENRPDLVDLIST